MIKLPESFVDFGENQRSGKKNRPKNKLRIEQWKQNVSGSTATHATTPSAIGKRTGSSSDAKNTRRSSRGLNGGPSG